MATFSEIDKRLSEDGRQLHDFLWHPGWKGDSKRLIDNLVRDARDLDAFLKVGGKLSRAAETLARDLAIGKAEGAGEALFEMLSHAFYLTAATEDLKREDFESTSKRLRDVVGSVTIGVCANAGCFEYVQEWEGGKVDFDTYAGKLATFLQGKGVPGSADWARMAQAAYLVGVNLGSSFTLERGLLARVGILNACWVTSASLSIRQAIGSSPGFSLEDYVAVLDTISRRA